MRPSGRAAEQMRPISFTPNFTMHAEGSVLVAFGNTKVICTASIEERQPRWMRDEERGWVTAEYGMLPRSTHSRMGREAARDGSAKSDELSGSTLTVTSLGPLGGVATTPVINRPEVAIIGPNRIIERPMFVTGADGQERIEKRKLMNISISCDHRVVDGWDAASFIQALKNRLEAPATILAA